MPADDPISDEPAAVLADLRAAVAFLTRIPAAWIGGSGERPDFARAARVFPVVGAAVGLAGGATLLAAMSLGAPATIAATLAVAATMTLTGAMHEDGLADTLDGFGGGATREKKLEIMRDSRIGTYGAAGLVFSILIRVGTLAALAEAGAWPAAFGLVAAEAASRAALMRAWSMLPPARTDGLAHDTGPPSATAMLTAQVLAVAIALAAVWPHFGPAAAVAAILVSLGATYILIAIARAEIGGRTGDTLGAAQQVAAAAFLVTLAAAA